MSNVDLTKRSHRPSPSPGPSAAAKDRPKTVAEAQKAQLEKLFVDPGKEVYIPNAPQPKKLAAPRDMIPNVQGSSAGAGSGEFHVYKQARRREYERLKQMEDEDAKEKAEAEFKARQAALKAADEERTAKNRAKRLKKRAKRGQKGKAKETSGNGVAGKKAENGEGADSSDDSDSDEDGEGELKKRKLANAGILFRGADEREEDYDQPREEEIKVKRIEEAVYDHPSDSQTGSTMPSGITIVDED